MNNIDNYKKLKQSLELLLDVTPYDLLEFNNRIDEEKYIEKKTNEFNLYNTLLNTDYSMQHDGIIVISEDKFYAINPIFIHGDAYKKFFSFLEEKEVSFNYTNQDIIEYYNKKGYVLFRVVNNNGIIGCDPYIPEKLNDYQIRKIENITCDLCRVNKELEDFDRKNSDNISYAIKTIKNSIKESKKILKK